MSYTALYRKYRPHRFSDVYGQDAITQTLRNQIITGKNGHAYLFSGPRGTGKTSMAKIFANAVNCQSPVNGEPCGKCNACTMTANGANPDILEIDAASNTGVDHIRQLIDEAMYKPQYSTHKVYIIDEIHMLSASAFNALLKTLEEPPGNVIFILATTEESKVPATIYSRCQRFRFKTISNSSIAESLSSIAIKEGVQYDDSVPWYIAELAAGSLRDAVSLFDQCITFCGQHITSARLHEIFGMPDKTTVHEAIKCLDTCNTKKLFEVIARMKNDGRDMRMLCRDMYMHYRDDYINTSSAQSMRNMRILAEISEKLKYDNSNVMLEVAFMKMCVPEMETGYEKLESRIKQLEEEINMAKQHNTDNTGTGMHIQDTGNNITIEYSGKPGTDVAVYYI